MDRFTLVNGKTEKDSVLENKFGNDKDIQRIMSLNIPDDLRLKILDNYKKTGVLPKILVKEKQSGSTRAPAGDDDPYNKKNW